MILTNSACDICELVFAYRLCKFSIVFKKVSILFLDKIIKTKRQTNKVYFGMRRVGVWNLPGTTIVTGQLPRYIWKFS